MSITDLMSLPLRASCCCCSVIAVGFVYGVSCLSLGNYVFFVLAQAPVEPNTPAVPALVE